MKLVLVAGMVLVALAACSSERRSANAGVEQPRDQDSEAYMRKAEADWAALPPRDQPAMLQRVLADDFVGVGTRGTVRNKQQQIQADLDAPPGPPAKLDYVHYRHFGNTVLAQGQETTPQANGQPAKTLVWLDVWMLRNGKWQIVAAQDTVLQPK